MKRIGIFLLLCLALPQWAWGGQSMTLSLTDAVELAWKHNPDVGQARENVQAAKSERLGSIGSFLPSIAVGASAYHQKGNGGMSMDNNAMSGMSVDDEFNGLNATASAEMPLFSGMKNIASYKSADLAKEAAKQSRTWSRETVAYEVISRYLQVLEYDELVRLNETIVEQNRLQLESIEAFYKAGRRPITDLYQQKAELATAEKNLVDAERNLKVAQVYLTNAMGLQADVELVLVAPAAGNSSEKQPQPSDQDSLNLSLDDRADIVAQKYTTEAAEKNVTVAHAGYWPTLSLFADLQSGYSDIEGGSSFNDQFTDEQVVATAGVQLSVPIFDRLQTCSASGKAKAQQRIAELELQKLKLQATTEWVESSEDYRTAQKQITVAESGFQAAEQSLQAVESQYQAGATDLLNLTTARNTYLQASADRIDAHYQLITKSYELAYREGRLIDVLRRSEKSEANQ